MRRIFRSNQNGPGSPCARSHTANHKMVSEPASGVRKMLLVSRQKLGNRSLHTGRVRPAGMHTMGRNPEVANRSANNSFSTTMARLVWAYAATPSKGQGGVPNRRCAVSWRTSPRFRPHMIRLRSPARNRGINDAVSRIGPTKFVAKVNSNPVGATSKPSSAPRCSPKRPPIPALHASRTDQSSQNLQIDLRGMNVRVPGKGSNLRCSRVPPMPASAEQPHRCPRTAKPSAVA